MAHLPKTNDIVVVHHVIEDAGVDQYHTFKMIDSIIDEGIEVYILKNRWGGYLAATHRDFEYIHYPEEQGFTIKMRKAPSFREGMDSIKAESSQKILCITNN